MAVPGRAGRGNAGRGMVRLGMAWLGVFLLRGPYMSLVTLGVKIVGMAPLLMHNCQLADPTNEIVRRIKSITAKGKKKTDSDLEELARLEFIGGLYVNEDGVPSVPGTSIEGAICDGARKSRAGKDATCGVMCEGYWPLEYSGPKDQDALWGDRNFRDMRSVVIGQSRIMRMRPRFSNWKLQFQVSFIDEVVNEKDLRKWIVDAGRLCGILDYRPRCGRFEVESIALA